MLCDGPLCCAQSSVNGGCASANDEDDAAAAGVGSAIAMEAGMGGKTEAGKQVEGRVEWGGREGRGWAGGRRSGSLFCFGFESSEGLSEKQYSSARR